MDTIEINGQGYAIHFGMAALASFCRKEGIALNEMEKGFVDLDLLGTANLVFAGVEQGARKLNKDLTLTVEDILDAMDESPELLNKALELFAASQGQGKKKAKGR